MHVRGWVVVGQNACWGWVVVEQNDRGERGGCSTKACESVWWLNKMPEGGGVGYCGTECT